MAFVAVAIRLVSIGFSFAFFLLAGWEVVVRRECFVAGAVADCAKEEESRRILGFGKKANR